MGMSYLISLNPKLLKNIAYFHSTRCWLQLKSLLCYFRSYHTWLISGRNLDWAYHRGCKHSGIGWWGSRCIASFTALPRQIPTSFVGPLYKVKVIVLFKKTESQKAETSWDQNEPIFVRFHLCLCICILHCNDEARGPSSEEISRFIWRGSA